MTQVTSIYELHKIVDNPIFEGFAFENERSLLRPLRYSSNDLKRLKIDDDLFDDFFPRIPYVWNWELESLRQLWRPPRVTGRVATFNDFPCISMSIPAFSAHAIENLRDLLEPNGELLEFYFDNRQYFAFHCRNIVEILDHNVTVGTFYEGYSRESKKPALGISYLGVVPESIHGLTIFRLRELPNRTFVSNVFSERVTECLLTGFDFAKAWPLPPGSDYEIEYLQSKKKGTRSFSHLKEQSIVICFRIENLQIERKRIASIEDAIDAHLFVPSSASPYFGALEGKRTSKGITRLYLSCPNAERLFEKLRPWLQTIEQPSKPRVFLKKVPYDHVPADQIEVFP